MCAFGSFFLWLGTQEYSSAMNRAFEIDGAEQDRELFEAAERY